MIDVCFFFLSALVATHAQVVVDTHLGQVQGQTVATHYDGISVNTFHGIPFAASTEGNLRWTEPVDPDPYDGVFEASRLGNACIQDRGADWLWLTHPGWNRYSEDCLNLDVYTPSDMNPDEPYPVMVFWHGGAFTTGSTIQYPGHFLAARDVIVVNSNYRLGIFGFLSTNDSVAPGNYGLYDQRHALLWIQKNIANFGGDRNRVTIFGQSAGGASVGHHMISPASQDLFHQVIEHSGTDVNFWAINWPASKPETYGQWVAEQVGCPTDSTVAQIECMRQADQWELHELSQAFNCTPGHFCLGFGPVVDGPTGFIPDIPLEMRKRGEFVDVPVMTGYLKDDGALYTLAYIPESMDGGFTHEEFEYHLREDLLGFWSPQLDAKTTEDAFQALSFFYSPWPYIENEILNREAFNVLVTDGAFSQPSDRQARFHAELDSDNPVYQFVFAYRGNESYGGLLNGTEWMGCFHSAELPYIFGYPLLLDAPEVRNDSKIFVDIFPYNQEDKDYAEFMHDLWTNFAKFGNPTPEPITPPFGNPEVTWEQFNMETFNSFFMAMPEDPITNVGDYSQKGNAFWREYMTYIFERDFYSVNYASQQNSHVPVFSPQRVSDARKEVVEMFLAQQYDVEVIDY